MSSFAPLLPRVVLAAAAVLLLSGEPASAQTETLLYDHVHMAVPDPQAAALWYHDLLGGERVDGQPDRIFMGTTQIVFLSAQDRAPSAGGGIDHLGFSVPDLEATLAAMVAAGATVTGEIRDVPGLFRFAFVDDPWGVRLEILEDLQHLGFHHLHLRSPDPQATLAWYHERFGGVRMALRGRLDGLLYPGNVWLLVQQGDAIPSQETVIDHLGWRTPDLEEKLRELRVKGIDIQAEPRSANLPSGPIQFSFVAGPDGTRIELVERARDAR